MKRIGIRQLRNDASGAVRRAMAGERLVITINGVPAAQLGPLGDARGPATVDDLIAAGRLRPRRSASPPPAPRPVRAPCARTSTDVLREHRDR